MRRYALREVKVRLHQQGFRIGVLRAYRERCAICSLRERELIQAAHIVADPSPEGIAAVVNGLALCAIGGALELSEANAYENSTDS